MIIDTNFNKIHLKNGIKLIYHDIPFINSISVGVWVNTGSRDECPENNGVSHLIEHMLFKGTKNRTSVEIARQFDRLGGISNAFTSRDLTCYYGLVLRENLWDILELFSDMLCNPLFNKMEFEREKNVVLQEIDMVLDNPEEYLFDLFYESLWANNPAGLPIQGKKNIVTQITQEDLLDFYKKNYVSGKITISLAGNLGDINLNDQITKKFFNIPDNYSISNRVKPDFKSGFEIFSRPLEQTIFILGFNVPSLKSDNYIPLQILNIIFGGNMSSFLFQEIREKRGLCYSVYSFISSLEDAGVFGIFAGTSPKKISEIIKYIYNKLEELSQNPIKDDILSEAKNYLRKEILLSMENNEAIMKKNAKDEIYFGKYYSFSEYIMKINEVTPKKLQNIVNSMLNEKGFLICMGDVKEKYLKTCLNFF